MESDVKHSQAMAPARVTQVLGLCFYWAWVYLSFNASSSINLQLATDASMLWVHLASMLAGVITYALIVAFSRPVLQWFTTRKMLIAAGVAMAAGTACYALPLGQPLALVVIGGVVTGFTSPWVLVYWGTLYSKFSARNIVLFTALAFLAANVLYFGSLLLPVWAAAVLVCVMPLCAVLLIPGRSVVRALGAEDTDESLTAGFEPAAETSGNMLVPLSRLPWRVAASLFVVMFVYGGVRVYVGVADASVDAGLLPTVLLTFATAAVFVVWGLFFQRNSASLGVAYKVLLPLLATTLLLIAIFGAEYAVLLAPVATVCNIVIEVLSWILLADLARTTRVPAPLVFAVGRGTVQAGMFCGQLTGWVLMDAIVPFAVAGVYALMLVMGFLFKDQDTLLVFEAPSPAERQQVEQRTGEVLDSRLDALAVAHGLTQRESEIFRLWATGHGSKYIQDALVISPATVKTHVRHIYEKFNVHNRAEIIALLEQPEELV